MQQENELKDKVDDFQPERNTFFDDFQNKSPIDYFELFFDDELIDYICKMTNHYAIEKNAVNWTNIEQNEMRCFIAILMFSGYVTLPSFNMY